MRRSLTVFVIALLGLIGGGFAANVANASGFGEICNNWSGCAAADMSFSNRSATIQGYVFDDKNEGSTTVMFEFYAGGDIYSTQTRTANREKRSFNFTEAGPVGGFDFIRAWLIWNSGSGSYKWLGDHRNRG